MHIYSRVFKSGLKIIIPDSFSRFATRDYWGLRTGKKRHSRISPALSICWCTYVVPGRLRDWRRVFRFVWLINFRPGPNTSPNEENATHSYTHTRAGSRSGSAGSQVARTNLCGLCGLHSTSASARLSHAAADYLFRYTQPKVWVCHVCVCPRATARKRMMLTRVKRDRTGCVRWFCWAPLRRGIHVGSLRTCWVLLNSLHPRSLVLSRIYTISIFFNMANLYFF